MTLEVAAGERLCVLGANGSGKSTLASVVCGLLAPDEGRVTLVGEDVFGPDGVSFDAYRVRGAQLGLVFQNPDDQIVTSVVEEDVAFGPENLGVPSDQIGARVERELARVAMTDYAKADPTRLSGGQKQRVAIAGALAMEPRVLVLDEPGALLDVRGRRGIMRVMAELRDEGTTIVHITHFMEEALAADRVVVMDHGRIVLEGTPAEVFAHGEELAKLGLEAPFVARLSRAAARRGLDVPWTCDEPAPRAPGSETRARTPPIPWRLPHSPEGMDRCPGVTRGRRVSYSYATDAASSAPGPRPREPRATGAPRGHRRPDRLGQVHAACACSAPSRCPTGQRDGRRHRHRASATGASSTAASAT